MNRKIISIVVGTGILIGAGVVGAFYLKKDGGTPESETAAKIDSIARGTADASSAESAFPSDVAVPVEGSPVIQDTMIISVTAAGEAAAWRQAVVSALVSGQLKFLGARENASVSQGALLAAIDSAQYVLSLAQAQASLRQAQASFREITLSDDRITDPAIRAEREKTARSKSGLETAELRVEEARLNLSRASSHAPFAARVASIMAVPGQWVAQGAELMTLLDISRVKVDVQVLESEVNLLTPGRFARIQFAAMPGEIFVGRIETINPMVDPKTRSARVVVSLNNPRGRILPGMYARVALDARQLPDRIMVPRSAILERDRRKMLFVYEENGSSGLAKWRYVTTGAENETMVEIVANEETQMVKPGEIVLTGGHHTLSHDARVRVVQNVMGAEGARTQ
ncbi:MAG: efflux RND transporter periplasmic adaptor subunit [Gemmatimonadota bacterium]